MGGFGWDNGFPFQLGGGPTLEDRVYESMRAALGVGGSCDDEENSIESLMLQAQAIGFASAVSFDESAAMQAFPSLASDLIPDFEEVLRLTAGPDDELSTRRDRVTAAWTEELSAVVSKVELELKKIDDAFSILNVTWATSDATAPGRYYEGWDGTDAFVGVQGRFVNFSTEFYFYVLYDIGAGVKPSSLQHENIANAKRVLARLAPAWMNWYFGTQLGFILDQSLLDCGLLVP